MNKIVSNPMLDIKMPGADTKDAQIYLFNFCQECLEGCPTDAAFQLMRDLTVLASREAKARNKSVVTSIVSHLPRRFKDE